jgi:hypothetical protein
VTLTTVVDGAEGQRSFEAPSCVELAHATALILAMMVDPAAKPLPPPAPKPVPEPPRVTSHREEHSHALSVAMGPVLAGGILPSVATGLELGLGWTPRYAVVELSGALFLAQHADLTARPDLGADLRGIEGLARGCGILTRGILAGGPCLGAGLVSMSGSGSGAREPLDGYATWAELLAGGRLLVALSDGFSVRLHVDAVIPLSRPTFVMTVDGVEQALHRPSAIYPRAMVAGELHFF